LRVYYEVLVSLVNQQNCTEVHTGLSPALLHSSSSNRCVDYLRLSRTNDNQGDVTTSSHPIQKEITSEKLNGLIQLADELLQTEPREALIPAHEAIELAKTLNDDYALAQGLRCLGLSHYHLSDYDVALRFMFEAVELAKSLQDLMTLSECERICGSIYLSQGRLSEALQRFEVSLDLAQQTGNQNAQSSALNNIAIIYRAFEENERALEFENQNLKLSQSIGDVKSIIRASNAIGLIHLELAENKSEQDPERKQELLLALDLFEQALQAARETQFRPAEIALLNNIGCVYMARHEPQKALEFFDAQLEIAQAFGDRKRFANGIVDSGRAHLALGNLNLAFDLISEAHQAFEEVGAHDELAKTHKDLSAIFEARGNITLALEHFKQFHTLEATVKSDAAKQRTQTLAAKFDLEKSRLESEMYRIRTTELESKVAERTQEVLDAQFEMLERLANAAEFRDSDTGTHTRRVGRIASAVGKRLGLPREDALLLRSAAQLHDIGKIGIPDAILFKRGTLTDVEWEIMKSHTTLGAKMLEDGKSRLLQMAEEIAMTHHERFDGTGYPVGLVGTDIPLTGRVVAVVDMYDALLSERPYKGAWSKTDALYEIKRVAGTHFDPAVVRVFLDVIESDLTEAWD
jgi:putative nucleotidyltransferase with HDIG domain